MAAAALAELLAEEEVDENDLIVERPSGTLITEVYLSRTELLSSRSADRVFVLPQTVNITAARDALLRSAPFAGGKKAAAMWRYIVDDPVFQKLLGAAYHHFAACFQGGKLIVDRLYDIHNSRPLKQLAQTLAEMYISFESSKKKVLTRHLPEIMGFMSIHCLSTSLPKNQRLYDSKRFRMLIFDWCFEMFAGLRPTAPLSTHAWFFGQQAPASGSNPMLPLITEEVDPRKNATLRARYRLNNSPLMELYLQTIPRGLQHKSAVCLTLSHSPDRSITTTLSSSPAVVVSLHRKPLSSKTVQKHVLRAAKLAKRVTKEVKQNNSQSLADIKASRIEMRKAMKRTDKEERKAVKELQVKKKALENTLEGLGF